jgi:hypothetical protein
MTAVGHKANIVHVTRYVRSLARTTDIITAQQSRRACGKVPERLRLTGSGRAQGPRTDQTQRCDADQLAQRRAVRPRDWDYYFGTVSRPARSKLDLNWSRCQLSIQRRNIALSKSQTLTMKYWPSGGGFLICFLQSDGSYAQRRPYTGPIHQPPCG